MIDLLIDSLHLDMFALLRKIIPLDSPLRLTYHYFRGFLAYHLSGDPAEDMIVIGVTGTKGKTTTTNLIARGLQLSGKKVAMFSTVNKMIDGKMYENTTKMTSPGPFDLWRFLNEAKQAGCQYAVVETSSHALYYHRVYGLRYDIAVLTNISQDHLDLHKTMENYVATKLLLFKNLYKYGLRKDVKKVSVVNVDSPYSSEFLSKEIVTDVLYTYGFSKSAHIRADEIKAEADNMSFKVFIPSNQFTVHTKLRGEFNIYNILAAISVLMSQKVEISVIQKLIESVEGIPGRLESVHNTRGAYIFVDYAHTEDSLENVLQTLRKIEGKHRIITLFGATGDRDKTKRPKMGRVVDMLSDVVILTDDDTYTENSLSIIRDVSSGINRSEGENFWIIPEREDAIRTALIMLQPGDILLLAGKGAESVQVTQRGSIPWNDKKVTERILMEIESQVIVS